MLFNVTWPEEVNSWMKLALVARDGNRLKVRHTSGAEQPWLKRVYLDHRVKSEGLRRPLKGFLSALTVSLAKVWKTNLCGGSTLNGGRGKA